MELLVFSTQAALSMALISFRIGSFAHKRIFPNELRVSAIGFCFLISLFLEQVTYLILSNQITSPIVLAIQFLITEKHLRILLGI